MLRHGSLLSALAGMGTGGSDGGCFLRTQLEKMGMKAVEYNNPRAGVLVNKWQINNLLPVLPYFLYGEPFCRVVLEHPCMGMK